MNKFKKFLSVFLAIVIVLTLWTSCILSSTFAKYATSGISSTSARVAKWGVVIDTDISSLFLNKYGVKNNEDVISVDLEEVVAPGTENAINLFSSVSGKPEVAVEVSNIGEVSLENWVADGKYYCPLAFTINGESAVGTEFDTADEFEAWIESKISKTSRQYPPGIDLATEEGIAISISWQWAFEGDQYSNDAGDTFLMEAENKATITFDLTQTVVQIESYKPYMRYADNTLIFGTYPQREVKNETLLATLNSKAGKLPTSENSYDWTSYGYYYGGAASDYMWYIDVEEGGNKYRGVYFTEYRPLYTGVADALDENLRQLNNGYFTENVYWFKYEPISWTILSEDTSNGTALILCDMIIDAQAFQNDYKVVKNADGKNLCYNISNGVPDGIYANNYAYSTVRSWLNDTFYNTAFNELQKELIELTEVDNSASVTSNTNNPYACENTNDRIFLLSYRDVMNAKKGYFESDKERYKKPTAYAKAQGTYTEMTDDAYLGHGRWYLRTPNYLYSYYSHAIMPHGSFYSAYIYDVGNGIAPALQIKLD